MLLSKTHPGKAGFVPGARLLGPEQRGDTASKQPPHRCSPPQDPRVLNATEQGKAAHIHLPRETFRFLSSQTARVVVTVLNIQQLGMFKVRAGTAGIPPAASACCCRLGSGSIPPTQEVNQTGQVLDDTVVGITVGETSISGLRDPVQLSFAHRQLPGISQPCPPSVSTPVPHTGAG